MSCKVCEEKQHEIDRILRGYRKDKEYFRKWFRFGLIVVAVQMVAIVYLAAFGAEGLDKLSELALKIWR